MRPTVRHVAGVASTVTKWTGRDKGVPLNEYFEAKEIVAYIGSWSEADMVQIAILRLFDSVRAFYNVTRERHERNI